MRHHRPHPIDPLAALSEKALRRRARGDVQQAYSPLIDALARHAKGGYANIEGISNQLAGQLGGYQGTERDIYQRASKALGDYNQQSADRLGMGTPTASSAGASPGASDADALRQRLALSGQSGQGADQLAQSVRGAQAAGFTRGGAELQALTGRQAAAEEYASKLPGIARLAGLQDVNERQARYQQDTADLQSHIPGEVAQAIQHARDVELQKATANLGFRGDIYKQQAANARANAANRVRMASIRAANERTGMTLAERARHNGVSEREQAQRDAEAARNHRVNEGTARENAKTARENAKTSRYRAHHSKKGKGKGSSFWDG